MVSLQNDAKPKSENEARNERVVVQIELLKPKDQFVSKALQGQSIDLQLALYFNLSIMIFV